MKQTTGAFLLHLWKPSVSCAVCRSNLRSSFNRSAWNSAVLLLPLWVMVEMVDVAYSSEPGLGDSLSKGRDRCSRRGQAARFSYLKRSITAIYWWLCVRKVVSKVDILEQLLGWYLGMNVQQAPPRCPSWKIVIFMFWLFEPAWDLRLELDYQFHVCLFVIWILFCSTYSTLYPAGGCFQVPENDTWVELKCFWTDCNWSGISTTHIRHPGDFLAKWNCEGISH